MKRKAFKAFLMRGEWFREGIGSFFLLIRFLVACVLRGTFHSCGFCWLVFL